MKNAVFLFIFLFLTGLVAGGVVPINGTLVITSEPVNAPIYINGTLKGRTSLNITLNPGVYIINVTNGKAWNATTVTLTPGEKKEVVLSLPKSEESEMSLLPILGLFLLAGVGAGVYIYRSRQSKESSTEVRKTDSFIEVKAERAFGISHIGNRENNEDNLLILKLPDAYLLAVADGLGGHNAGEVASQISVDTLKEIFEREDTKEMSEEEVKALLGKAHELAHKKIKKNAIGEREGMGTTLVTAFIRNGKAIIANTGDSRAYLIRGGKIVSRTKDHSFVQQLLDKGEITEEEAKRHPMRNIITKALGIDFGVDFYEWELERGDVLLLSTDGLHDYVDDSRIAEIVSQGKSAEEIVRKLIEDALPVTKDNVTVVVWKG
ncbi:PEGA domain-containing protein [Thermococcus sp. M39]|uniref:protein phosphatase 2C domain-containing protein n=1 Tax=Thermococcus sp. M39 TaxID=1638262 RepID=UPI00143C929D|nr:protein phosphatase 2C domain-containing protein [Thermococcus sp. M39]NJE08485.1 PEGA domain-containing protein [Thermococcus sp. M39]